MEQQRKSGKQQEKPTQVLKIHQNYSRLRQCYMIYTKEIFLLPNTSTLYCHWQHIDMFEIHGWNCPKDTVLYRRILEQKRTFKFLLRLNKNLDEVGGRIMGTKPLPNLREAFYEVRREESRKKVMMGPQTSALTMEGSALATRGYSNSNYDNQQRKGRQ